MALSNASSRVTSTPTTASTFLSRQALRFAEQLIAYKAQDETKRIGGLVLEVKGDFCHKVTRTDYRFDMKTFTELKNAQAIAIAYDGLNPMPPMFCYLKPYYNDVNRSYFEQLASGEI